ncbi:MAG: disulfide bond formation protein B [Deltaproteobacteria bacterium]|nr:disulfide bond formation protein B [Deltaproteobacteria bacterium]
MQKPTEPTEPAGPGRAGSGPAAGLLGLPDALFGDFWGTLKLWQDGRGLWLCGGLSALALELFSYLYFQRHLKLSPCEYCVLIRFAMLMILAGGLLGAVLPKSPACKLPGLALSLAGSVMGLRWTIVLEGINLAAQMDPDYLPVCRSGRVSFPLGIPLDRLLPGHFTPGGSCGVESLYEFWGMTMPQWLLMIFLVYAAGLCLMGISAALPRRAGAAPGEGDGSP